MNVKVNDKCIGCGTCAAVAPDVFDMTEGKATVKADCDTAAHADKINEAKDACPVVAIEIE